MPASAALITGGTSGTGRATAELLHSRGYRVMVTGRDAEAFIPSSRLPQDCGDFPISSQQQRRLIGDQRSRPGVIRRGNYMKKTAFRHAFTPATILALTLLLTTTAGAAEEPSDAAPENVTSDQVASQESGDSVVDGSSKSVADVVADQTLSALPEVSTDGDSGIMRCDNPATSWVKVSDKTNYHVPSWWNGTSYKDGPGGSMRVSVEKAGKIGVEVSGTAGVSASVVLAEVKAEYSAKVVGEVGVTVGHTYTHAIPAKKYGHLQYGSWGYKVNWTKYKTSSDRCSKVKVGSGTAKLPTKEVGWRYWATNS